MYIIDRIKQIFLKKQEGKETAEKSTFILATRDFVTVDNVGRWLYNRLKEEGIKMKPLIKPWDKNYPDGLDIERLYPDGFKFTRSDEPKTGDIHITWWVEQ